MHWNVFPGTIHQGKIEDHAQPLQTSSCLKLSLLDSLFRLRSLSWPMFGSSIFFVVSRYFWQLLLQTSWSWRWMMGYDGFAGISSRIWEWVNTYGTTSQLCWWQMLEDGRVHTFFGHSLLSHRYLQLQNSAITQKAPDFHDSEALSVCSALGNHFKLRSLAIWIPWLPPLDSRTTSSRFWPEVKTFWLES